MNSEVEFTLECLFKGCKLKKGFCKIIYNVVN